MVGSHPQTYRRFVFALSMPCPPLTKVLPEQRARDSQKRGENVNASVSSSANLQPVIWALRIQLLPPHTLAFREQNVSKEDCPQIKQGAGGAGRGGIGSREPGSPDLPRPHPKEGGALPPAALPKQTSKALGSEEVGGGNFLRVTSYAYKVRKISKGVG